MNKKTEYMREFRGRNKELVKINSRKHHLKRHYGMTLEDYDKMLTRQNFQCAICSKHHTECNRGLHVDHNHETGKIRGLLCQNCNHLIGVAKEEVSILQSAMRYLKEFK